MANKSYQYWQCDKCDEMNSSDIYKCKKCGAPIPAIYNEESEFENPYDNGTEDENKNEEKDSFQIKEQSSYRKKEKSLPELQKEFYGTWITVGNISIFCFIVNVIIIIVFFIALVNGTLRL